MKFYKLKYKDGTIEVKQAESMKSLIRKYDLCTKEHISTRIFELSGEQEAIARDNFNN